METPKSINDIINVLNNYNITVYNYKEKNKIWGYELNTYTDAGVNQIIFIDFRDTNLNTNNPHHFIQLFNQYTKNIDVDEEIRYLMLDKQYIDEIGLTKGIKDLTDWKYKMQNIFNNEKTAEQIQCEQTKDKLQTLVYDMQDILKLMPKKGNSENDCQKLNILYHLKQLEHCINGIDETDFIPNEYSEGFQLS